VIPKPTEETVPRNRSLTSRTPGRSVEPLAGLPSRSLKPSGNSRHGGGITSQASTTATSGQTLLALPQRTPRRLRPAKARRGAASRLCSSAEKAGEWSRLRPLGAAATHSPPGFRTRWVGDAGEPAEGCQQPSFDDSPSGGRLARRSFGSRAHRNDRYGAEAVDLEGERSPWKERAHQCWQRRWDATDSSVEEGLEVGPSARSALNALAGNGLRGRCNTRARASRAIPSRSVRRWRRCAGNDSIRFGGGSVDDVVEVHLGGSELRPEALYGPPREPPRW
jgi:hypothetical protein